VIAASTLGCERQSPPPQPRELSVIWVVLDAAGARYFGCYGNERPTTPKIDAFAESATRFERAYAQAAWTLPSTGSFLTGRYPPMQRRDLRLTENETLAAVLQREGLRTAAFSENPYVTREFGFGTGFDEFREYFPYDVIRETRDDFERQDSQRTVDDALAWVRANQNERIFLYVHLLPPHAPYDAPPPFGGRFDRDRRGAASGRPLLLAAVNDGRVTLDAGELEQVRLAYQENLAFGDHQVGRLLDGLAELGRLERSLVIVASDHGEAFQEHGLLMHTATVYEEMIHVPLLLRLPSAERLPERFGGVVELRSIYPTICEALALRSCPPDLAPSLLERIRDAGTRPGLARSWARGRQGVVAALVLDRHKLIARGLNFEPLALYDLHEDPGESTDLRAQRPERVREARVWLHDPQLDFFPAGEATVDRATRERLEALGYTE